MGIPLSICTTATVRPKILQTTYRSFVDRVKDLHKFDVTLYINIDPLPSAKREKIEKTKFVAKKFFKNVVFNVPRTPNFCASVNWLWSHAKDKFMFHLEDDWQFLSDFELCQVLEMFNKYPSLYEVRLRRRTKEYALCMYGLSPGVFLDTFYKKVGGRLDETKNPERQLREVSKWGLPDHQFSMVEKGGKHGLKYLPMTAPVRPFPEKPRIHLVRDIGRNWRKHKHMSKPAKKHEPTFTTWEYRKKIIR